MSTHFLDQTPLWSLDIIPRICKGLVFLKEAVTWWHPLFVGRWQGLLLVPSRGGLGDWLDVWWLGEQAEVATVTSKRCQGMITKLIKLTNLLFHWHNSSLYGAWPKAVSHNYNSNSRKAGSKMVIPIMSHYCCVLLKWEFFIKIRASYLQPSSLQYSSFWKEGGSKAGSSHFNEKFSF